MTVLIGLVTQLFVVLFKDSVMKPNTLIRLADGRIGRTVYNGLDGYGIKFGEEKYDVDNLPEPDAMLREPYPSAEYECVGKKYIVVQEGGIVFGKLIIGDMFNTAVARWVKTSEDAAICVMSSLYPLGKISHFELNENVIVLYSGLAAAGV